MPIPNKTYLIERISKFQKRDDKRVYEETIKDRLDPKIFSVYKQYTDPKDLIRNEILEYVESGYVEDGYIVMYDNSNPPGDPL